MSKVTLKSEAAAIPMVPRERLGMVSAAPPARALAARTSHGACPPLPGRWALTAGARRCYTCGVPRRGRRFSLQKSW